MMFRRDKGLVLPAVICIVVIYAILGMCVLAMAQHEMSLSRIDTDKAKAFYLAEAGLAKMYDRLVMENEIDQSAGQTTIIINETLESGSFSVIIDVNQHPCYAISTGTSGTVSKTIRAQAIFLAPPLEHAVYAINFTGADWDFQLRGTGVPVPVYGPPGAEKGGKDIVSGNIYVDGDVSLYEESTIIEAPAPNPYNLQGDVDATGSIHKYGSSSIAGDETEGAQAPSPVDMIGMYYAYNHTHNVGQIFTDEGISSGYLPSGHVLRDVFVKNPSDRSSECSITTGDDFFFEPSSGFVTGGPYTGDTPLNAGQDRVYYVDGDVWIHSYPTYGFKMEGKVTIVATGDIHVCDNLEYADSDSILGLVALGKYDGDGDLISGGNIYFGDAVYGNMAMFSAMMFAANDFKFSTDKITHKTAEPDSGFTINGNFAAMGKVEIERDWYNKVTGSWPYSTTEKRAAHYKSDTGQWVDVLTGAVLTSTQISSLRHYQMVVNYDDRVRNINTQPPALPRGGSVIFAGFAGWEEL